LHQGCFAGAPCAENADTALIPVDTVAEIPLRRANELDQTRLFSKYLDSMLEREKRFPLI
jgi:hypothetical protein